MEAADGSSKNTLITELFGFRRHEIVPVAWSFAYFFCVLSSYYLIRPVREMMAVGSGPNTIPYLFIGTFFAMMVGTSIFGWVASRYPRRVFLPWVYLFFISNILIFWVVFSRFIDAGAEYVWLGRGFFVWISVFNLFVVSVFWSFMADIYNREQGRRLFGFIASGGSIGMMVASLFAERFMGQFLESTDEFHKLMPISAAILCVAVLCISRLKRWVGHEHGREEQDSAASEEPLGGSPLDGIKHLFSSNYFLGIAFLSVVASLLGTALYMFRAELVAEQIVWANTQTQFFAKMNFWTSIITIICQMVLVKQVVVRFGVGRAIAIFPFVSIIGFIFVALDPVLMAVAVVTVVRRGIGFGFTKPSTDMLYSVVSPEDKYKTKNAIDTAVYRAGDVVGTWTIRFMSLAGMSMALISAMMVPFAIASLFVALWLGRDYKRRAKQLHEKGVL